MVIGGILLVHWQALVVAAIHPYEDGSSSDGTVWIADRLCAAYVSSRAAFFAGAGVDIDVTESCGTARL